MSTIANELNRPLSIFEHFVLIALFPLSLPYRLHTLRTSRLLCERLSVQGAEREKAVHVGRTGRTSSLEDVRRGHLCGTETRQSLPLGPAACAGEHHLKPYTVSKLNEIQQTQDLDKIKTNEI